MTDTDRKIQEILAAFEPEDGFYKRQAVDAAIELKEEITPYLIKILEDVQTRPLTYLNTDTMSHIYALMLLGHFKEPRAHQAIVDLFSLPEKVIDRLYGDLITEDLPMILYQTCNGSLAQIKSLVLNKEAYEFCRTAATGAMVYAAAAGLVPREEVVNFLGSLFTGDEADPDSIFWSCIASDIYHLYPEELMEVIKQGFDNGLIGSWYIGMESFEEALQEGQEQTLAKVREEIERRSLDNLHESMSWWAMFDAEERPLAVARPAPVQFQSPPKAQVKQKDKKKARRKQARASQKKNRRRK